MNDRNELEADQGENVFGDLVRLLAPGRQSLEIVVVVLRERKWRL